MLLASLEVFKGLITKTSGRIEEENELVSHLAQPGVQMAPIGFCQIVR